jgi:methionyl-tRNA synthetase
VNNKTLYVTTPIYYPSDKLHIGHALTTTMTDTLARFKRLQGYDVYFLTGSDEHGQKIQRKAQDMGKTPLEYVDEIVATFKKLWQELDISYNDFIRTSEERHKKVVQEIFKKIYDKGDIYKSEYEGWYCTPCESFWTEKQLNNEDGEKLCPDCGRPVELVKEESYFFKMSKYADRLIKHIEENPDFIQPVTRRNEMISFIKQGLEDLCISRTTFDWGVSVPIDKNHVVYVWFDALTNYISALNYGMKDDGLFEKYWTNVVHFVGKDIVRFHTIIWPTILMAADIKLPDKVYGHGWLLVGGGKMSKSKGNVVDPMVLADKYGSDSIRYYLLREMPKGEDGYYTEKALVERINTDLANDFGNLLSRTTAMIKKFCDGRIPQPGTIQEIDKELQDMSLGLSEKVNDLLEKFEFNNALKEIWKLINLTNKYIDETAPWNLAKNPDTRERLNTVIYHMSEVLRIVTVFIGPFMPKTPAKVWEQLGIKEIKECHTWESIKSWGVLPVGTEINRGKPLFPRLEFSEEEKTESEEKPKKEKVPQITIDEFSKIDLRVAEVIGAEKIKKSDKLLKVQVKLGEEKRQIVAGISQHYDPQELVGKKVIMVANLKPTKLMGIKSQGMLLAASCDKDLGILTVEKDISDGAKVK